MKLELDCDAHRACIFAFVFSVTSVPDHQRQGFLCWIAFCLGETIANEKAASSSTHWHIQ